MNIIYLLLYLFPLLSFIFALLSAIFFLNKRENSKLQKSIEYAALIFSLFALLITSTQLYEVFKTGKTLSDSFSWANTGTREINILIKIDSLTAFFQFVVSLIVFTVHIYSLVYMKSKKLFYYGILGLFVFAMQLLLAQDNLILFFVSWELIGLASYLLIDFDKTEPSSRSSTKAFLLNRVGDVGLLVAIALFFEYSLSISDLKNIFASIPFSTQLIISISIFLAAFIKSGQFPFSWLADAMEAPTSISALLHAATMVAAGIYLLIRMEFVFYEMKVVADVMIYVALFSTIFSALSSYFTTNLKKELAASTVSQLGFMAIAVGVGAWQAAVLHLFTHAFFKGTLFLGAGFMINKHGSKEMAEMGKMNYKKFPLLFVLHGVAILALIGFPLTSGFLSKEWILKTTFGKHFFVGIGLLLATFLTAFYAGRQLQPLFFNKTDNDKSKESYFSKKQKLLWYMPIALLFIGSFWFIFSLDPIKADKSYWIKHLPKLYSHIPPHFSHIPKQFKTWLPIVATLITILGFAIGFPKKLNEKIKKIKILSRFKYFFLWQDRFFVYCFWKPITQTAFFAANSVSLKEIPNSISTKSYHYLGSVFSLLDRKLEVLIDNFSKLIVVLGYFLAWIDKYIVDFVTHFVVFIIDYSGKYLKSLQNGKVQSYLLIVISVLIVLLTYLTIF